MFEAELSLLHHCRGGTQKWNQMMCVKNVIFAFIRVLLRYCWCMRNKINTVWHLNEGILFLSWCNRVDFPVWSGLIGLVWFSELHFQISKLFISFLLKVQCVTFSGTYQQNLSRNILIMFLYLCSHLKSMIVLSWHENKRFTSGWITVGITDW